MLKIFKKVLAILVVIGAIFVGTSSTEAARLQVPQSVQNHTATIIVENITPNEVVQVVDLSGIKKMSGAIKWIEDNAGRRNLRFVSTDPELLDSWKQAAAEAGFKVKNPEENYKKVSLKAKKILRRGNNYSFEIKTIKTSHGNDLEKGISYVMGIAALVTAFN